MVRGHGGRRGRGKEAEEGVDRAKKSVLMTIKRGKKRWKGRQRRVSPDGTQSSSLKGPASVTATC